VSVLQGRPLGQKFPGYEVRPATAADVAACNRICLQVHGFDRAGELRDAIDQKAASVIEHLGRITGYTIGIAFFGHSVAETNYDLMALIGAAPEFGGPGFMLPTRNHEVFKWCLEAELKLVFQMTLMTIGPLQRAPRSIYAVCSLLRRSATCPPDPGRFDDVRVWPMASFRCCAAIRSLSVGLCCKTLVETADEP
jgi:hypothetical protein